MSQEELAAADGSAAAYVYIVRCADGTLYTGWATDVARRVQTHNAGRGARYTRQHGPVELVYAERQPSRSAALKREQEIKRRGRAYKERLVRDHTFSMKSTAPALDTGPACA